MAESCAQSTKKKRTTVWRHWLKFLRYSRYTIPPIWPSELHICLWITWMFKHKLVYNTVRSYLYALAAEIKFRGGRDIVDKFHSWFIHTTMKHFRLQLGTQPLVYRRPLTVALLNQLLATLDLRYFNVRVYATMLAVGVYCLMRIGEVCSVTQNKVCKFIKNKDLVFGYGYIQLTLWKTKTDKDRRGVLKYISNLISAPFNPYVMMIQLKAIKVNSLKPNDAFFALASGKPVTKHMLVKFLQANMRLLFPKIDPREWTGISLRKGGATSALRVGVAGEVIQKMGNWTSNIYRGYIDHSLVDVAGAQNLMATTMHT
jgi:integrase